MAADEWVRDHESMEDPEELNVMYCALDSFSQYSQNAHLNSTHLRRRAFYALPRAHWEMLAAPPFNYLDTLERVDDAIDSNAELARKIVECGLRSSGLISPDRDPVVPEEWSGLAKANDTDKARSTIRQFYRDWSAEGQVERDACYRPIFRALKAEEVRKARIASNGHPPDAMDEGDSILLEPSALKVLVPGAGLGRLVFELCCLGYDTEGNEISYHQLFASSYILNSCERAGQHTIYPWIHTFSNHRSRADQFKGYRVPDIHPQEAMAEAREASGRVGSMSMCAADFLCAYGDDQHEGQYDAVATVFFLDTAPNLIRYLEVIRRCLRPGGVLINVGPLLWHWENHVPGHHGYDGDGDGGGDEDGSLGIAEPGSFELTDEEVVTLVEKLGFVIERKEGDIVAPYIQDPKSMLQTVYRASHWIARKPET
ncbi:N2227-like protein-domain-containing protein [Xylariaceae sp. FL0594]|nr:N2227-like protein-domain-containing protein [Xylariaceae sp. FL0594]